MRGGVLLLGLLLLASGCLGGAGEDSLPSDTARRGRDWPGPPPPLQGENQTLVNATLKYPRLSMGTHHRLDFNLSLGARELFVEWQSLLECPAGRSQRAKFSLTNPNGDSSEHWLPHGMGEQNYWECRANPTGPHLKSPVSRVKPDPVAGHWIVRSLGDCMCSARFLITNEVSIPQG